MKFSSSSADASAFGVKSLPANKWMHLSKKRTSEEHPMTWMKALAYAHDLSLIPNEMVKLIWVVDLVTVPQPTIRLVSPELCWSRTRSLSEGTTFQWA